MARTIRVVIADDHPLYRDGVARACGIESSARAGKGVRLFQKLGALLRGRSN